MAERSVLVRLRGTASDLNRAILSSAAAVSTLRKEIDTTNDRTAWLAQSLLAIGPALAPIGAAGVPIIAGLSSSLFLTGSAAGVAAMALVGVGDALEAVNEYQLEPTAENLDKMREAMSKLGEDGAEFVRFLDSVGPAFTSLRMDARAGMFPGMTEGLEELVDLLPRISPIVTDIAEGIGQLSADAGAGLSGDGFRDFFEYLDRDAKPLLIEFGRTLGNFTEGLANMMVAFSPVTNDFSDGLYEMSASFADWSAQLGSDSTFQDFLVYVQESGPKVLDLFSAMVDAFVALAEAAAPVGDVMLPVLEKFFDVLTAFLSTPIAPYFLGLTAAMGTYGRAVALASITTGGLSKALGGTFLNIDGAKKALTSARPSVSQLGTTLAFAAHSQDTLTTAMNSGSKAASKSAIGAIQSRNAVAGFAKATGPAAAGMGLLALSMSSVDDKLGLTNTTMGAMVGLIGGPWGAAIGGAVGLAMDFAAANDDLMGSIEQLQAGLDSLGDRTATSGEVTALVEQTRIAHENLTDLANTLNDVDPTSLTSLMAGSKNAVEGLFGRDDYEEAYEAYESAREELIKVREASEDAAQAQQHYAWASGRAANQIANLEAAMQRWRLAAQEARTAARGIAEQFITLGDSLDDSKKSLGQWIREMEKQAQALRDFRINAQRAAENGLRKGLIEALHEMGPAGAMRMRQLANATESEIRRANRSWQAGQAEIRRYVQATADIPPKKLTRIDVDTLAAMMKLAALQDRLDWVARPRTARITLAQVYSAAGFQTIGGLQEKASGGTVEGQRHPYGDKVLVALAPGEEVITNRNGEADRFRADRAAGMIPGYADGGRIASMAQASGASISVASPNVSVGGPRVQVLIDGAEVRAVVRSEMSADRDFDRTVRGL